MEDKIYKRREYIIFMIFLSLLMLLVGKILIFQYFDSAELKVMAENQYQYKEKISELNYLLLDHDGKDLLNYSNEYYAVIDPYSYTLNDYYTKKDDLYALNIILKNYNKEYDIENIELKNKSQKIKWRIDETTYNKLRKIKGVKGFYTYKYVNVDRKNGWWNVENLLTNIYKINAKGEKEEKSKESIEHKIKERTKDNQFVYNVFKKDVNGNIYNEYLTHPQNNVNVRLTLDKYLQDTIKQILNKKPYNSYNQVGVVLMESHTGKIRAMVQKDDFKPNINLGISTNHGFFPGSIFKVIVEEAGLDTAKISLNHIYNLNPNLSKRYKGHERKESMNCEEALIESSNDIYAQIGIDVGIKNIKSFTKNQGLMDKVLNFDEETHGCFEGNDNEVGDVELTSFGQKQRITPIEAISIPNTVINNGIYVKPYLIEAYVDEDNNVIEEFTTDEKKVLSINTANILKKQMIKVVTAPYGTGKKAYIDSVEIGGKTGTAEREEGKDKFYDGWFAGFFKIDEEYYSMIVFVKDIGDYKSGGNTAAPIFKEIIKETYNYLKKF
ncbi:penicillin-binding transpeptidase domain-containing protein [Clostridium ganghwense]|uniref:Penicillin-binding transpeptidase domain-containing protein n=1 Tax=Clostridium ganghwense TaxID=312089 RepID=A0ABT4CTD0_9CLOT|nr:penicillin-binding transpeptidase domain-containing protein [Clostridium ganghwense]MCY6372327.1 penicillin-binding transpeptidase domain-containing protein [Clostridium ganghwense]